MTVRPAALLTLLLVAGGCTHYHTVAAPRRGQPSGKVVQVDHVRGLVEGLGIGLVTGAFVGGAGGYALGDDPCGESDWFCASAEDKATFGAMGLGAAGGLLGAVIGGVVGSRDVYEPDGQGLALSVTARPLPGGAQAGLGWSF